MYDLKYTVVLFKLKGHSTWRMTQSLVDFKNIKNVTEKKFIEIDRITGKIDIIMDATSYTI
jgi:ribosomal protein L16 Arg81 hydroxylase